MECQSMPQILNVIYIMALARFTCQMSQSTEWLFLPEEDVSSNVLQNTHRSKADLKMQWNHKISWPT